MLMLFSHPLEERCYYFAGRVRTLCRKVEKDTVNTEDIRQLIIASGLMGANYIRVEVNDKVRLPDLPGRLRLSRQATKESIHFLRLIETFGKEELEMEKMELTKEAIVLIRIFSAMLKKLETKEVKTSG